VGRVPGHRGEWIAASLEGVPVALLAGRAHLYEGFSAAEVAFPVRVLGSLGVRSLVLTNASGAVNPDWPPGQLALIADHINLQGTNPLIAPADESPSFIDLSEAYSAGLRQAAREAADILDIELVEGVYTGVLGPNFETPAEVR
jgi:purine-nucleoside phosphorylase